MRPNIDFQLQIAGSNTDFIHLKMICYEEYWIIRTFVLMQFDGVTFEKLYFQKMGSIFAGSCLTQTKVIKKTVRCHQLFRQN